MIAQKSSRAKLNLNGRVELVMVHSMDVVRRQVCKPLLCPFLKRVGFLLYEQHITSSAPDIPQFSPWRELPREFDEFDVGKLIPLRQTHFAYALCKYFMYPHSFPFFSKTQPIYLSP